MDNDDLRAIAAMTKEEISMHLNSIQNGPSNVKDCLNLAYLLKAGNFFVPQLESVDFA